MDASCRMRMKLLHRQLAEFLPSSSKPWLQVARSNEACNKKYCSKEGDFQEFGIPQGGYTKELLECIIESHGNKKKIAMQYPSEVMRRARGIQDLINWGEYELKRTGDEAPTVEVYFGRPGTGKTLKVYKKCAEAGDRLYVKPPGMWFDGYDGHTAILMDDYDGSCMKPFELLQLTDRYERRVQVKGGFTQISAMKIYITSNLKIRDWYSTSNWENVHCAAFTRRVTKYVELHEGGEEIDRMDKLIDGW